MFESRDELLGYITDNDVEFVDVRFCDVPGIMQHFTVPVSSFDETVFDNGLMFDGSSIRGFQAIHESDMALFPDPKSAFLDAFRKDKTLAVNFFIHDPLTGEAYSRDPRNIARKAEAYLLTTGIGDTAYFAPEAEFYVFDDVRFETKQNEGYYHIDAEAGQWNTGRVEEGGNKGYKVRYTRLLPGQPGRPLCRPAGRDEQGTRGVGADRRESPSRSRVRRAGRNQLQVQLAAQRWRRHHEVQVHHPQCGLGERQDRDVHAEADLR